jgi:hypothetical protein
LTSATSVAVNSKPLGTGTTLSGKTAAVMFSFKSANNTGSKINNLATPGTDDLYYYNSPTFSSATGGSYTFYYMNITPSGGNSIYTSTGPKATIGSNGSLSTGFTTSLQAVKSSTSVTGFSICYWINFATTGAYSTWEDVTTAQNRTNQIYFGSYGQFLLTDGGWNGSALSTGTWYFIALTFDTTNCYYWTCSVGSTFPSTANTSFGIPGNFTLNVTRYVCIGLSAWGDPPATFNIADYRIYTSNLSQSDLAGIFAGGPQ